MPEYHFKGSATLKGVDFFITADSLGAAMERAKLGQSDLTEDDHAEMVDWKIDVHSGRENK